MNKCLFITFSLISTLTGHAQFFTGEITYVETVFPKSDTAKLSEWAMSINDRTTKHIISENNFKTVRIDKKGDTLISTYHSDTKRIYEDYSYNGYITFKDSWHTDMTYNEPETFHDSIKVIAGSKAYKVITHDDGSSRLCYYSDEIKVNPQNFKEVTIDNWSKKLKSLNGALVLEQKINYSNFYVIKKAVKIEKKEILKEEFNLPSRKLVGASIMALDTKSSLIPLNKKQSDCYSKIVKKAPNAKKKTYSSYVNFMVTTKGEIKHLTPQYKDEFGYYKYALEIMNKCDFQFEPGKINDQKVNSKVFFGVPFPAK